MIPAAILVVVGFLAAYSLAAFARRTALQADPFLAGNRRG